MFAELLRGNSFGWSRKCCAFSGVTVVTVTPFPPEDTLRVSSQATARSLILPLRNLLMIFGTWELHSQVPKMTKDFRKRLKGNYSMRIPSMAWQTQANKLWFITSLLISNYLKVLNPSPLGHDWCSSEPGRAACFTGLPTAQEIELAVRQKIGEGKEDIKGETVGKKSPPPTP